MLTLQNGRLLLALLTLELPLLSGLAQAADPEYRLRVVTDRADALYERGDEARFLIAVTRGEEDVRDAAVNFAVDDFVAGGKTAGLPAGTVTTGDQPAIVSVTGTKPGFLKCVASFEAPDGKKVVAVAAAGFSPEQIELSLAVPDDFDAFWADQKRQLAVILPEPLLTPVTQPPPPQGLETFDVQVKCLGDAPVSGYFARPAGAQPKSLPAILWVHGAGVRGSVLGSAVTGAQHGMLSMDMNAHGLPNGRPAEFYQEQTAGRLPITGFRDARTARPATSAACSCGWSGPSTS